MRPVTLHLSGIQDPQVAAALDEIQRASQDTLQNDQSSSGGAMATLVGAAANQIAYFTSQYTTAFAALTAFGRSLIGAADAATATSALALGVWSSWTPVVSAPAGTIASYTVGSARYMQIGKLVIYHCDVTVTNVGSGTGNRVQISMPVNLSGASLHQSVGSGEEQGLTGKMIKVVADSVSPTIFQCNYYDNAVLLGTGVHVVIAGSYESV